MLKVKCKKKSSIIISSFNVSLYLSLWKRTALLSPLYLGWHEHCRYITYTLTGQVRPTH